MFTLGKQFHFKKITAVSLALALTFSGLPGFLHAAPTGTLPAKAAASAPFKQGTAVHRSGPPLCLKNGHATPCADKNSVKEEKPSQVESEEESIGEEQEQASAADDAEEAEVAEEAGAPAENQIETGPEAQDQSGPGIQKGSPDKKPGSGKGAAVAGALLGVGAAAGVIYYVAVAMKPKHWCGKWDCGSQSGCAYAFGGRYSGTYVADSKADCQAYFSNTTFGNSCRECDQ